MERISDAFISFSNLMEQDIRGVQIGCYSVAIIGLTIAMRKVRPFSKFKKPSDIPNHFIEERRELTGLVKRIEPNGSILMVQHKPLLDIPLISSGQLPVKISGVNVTGLGLNWLQAIVVGNEVKFVPIAKEKDFVQCEVLLLEMKNKKEHHINLGENLVKIGFGVMETVEKPLAADPKYLLYYNRLHSAEKFALRKKLGYKYYIKPTKKAVTLLSKYLATVLISTSKKIAKLPDKIPKMYAA